MYQCFLARIALSLAVGAMALSATVAQSAETSSQPRQPGGFLTDQVGTYLTIEGVAAEKGKFETGTLLVDTVDGQKLKKPIPLVVRGAVIAEHNLRESRLELPQKKRCVLKGYESGEMIGVPPAIEAATKEGGWKDVPMSQVPWQWRPHFVALVVVAPSEFELHE